MHVKEFLKRPNACVVAKGDTSRILFMLTAVLCRFVTWASTA